MKNKNDNQYILNIFMYYVNNNKDVYIYKYNKKYLFFTNTSTKVIVKKYFDVIKKHYKNIV